MLAGRRIEPGRHHSTQNKHYTSKKIDQSYTFSFLWDLLRPICSFDKDTFRFEHVLYKGLLFVVHFYNYPVLKRRSFSVFLAWIFLASSF